MEILLTICPACLTPRYHLRADLKDYYEGPLYEVRHIAEKASLFAAKVRLCYFNLFILILTLQLSFPNYIEEEPDFIDYNEVCITAKVVFVPSCSQH
jgi:hypothetical protein